MGRAYFWDFTVSNNWQISIQKLIKSAQSPSWSPIKISPSMSPCWNDAPYYLLASCKKGETFESKNPNFDTSFPHHDLRPCHSFTSLCAKFQKKTMSRVIYKVDHWSYDRAKPHMIGQDLFARSSWSSGIFTKPSSIIL